MIITSILETAMFFMFLLMLSVLSFDNIKIRIQNKKLKANMAQETIDKLIVVQKMQELMAEIDEKNSGQNDGFLKFVSESRNAAFQYIEEVQLALSYFDKNVGQALKHYEETGKFLGDNPAETMNDFARAYKKLMESMPKEEKGSE